MKIFLRMMICTLLSFMIFTPDVFSANGTEGLEMEAPEALEVEDGKPGLRRSNCDKKR